MTRAIGAGEAARGKGARLRTFVARAAGHGVAFAVASAACARAGRGAPSSVGWLAATGATFVLARGLLSALAAMDDAGAGAAATGVTEGDDEAALRRLAERLGVACVGTALLALGLWVAARPGLPIALAFVEGALVAAWATGTYGAGVLAAGAAGAGGQAVPRLALVGGMEPLHRALALGPETLGGRAKAVLVEGRHGPGAGVRGVRALDAVAFERSLLAGAFDRVLLVRGIAPSLSRWVEARCRAASVRCGGVFEHATPVGALSCLIAEEPERLLAAAGGTSSLAAGGERCGEGVVDETVAAVVAGRRVLLVGAAGALGAELARQLVAHRARKVVLADAAEHALLSLERELRTRAMSEEIAVARLLDLRDASAVAAMVSAVRPEVVIHVGARMPAAIAERHPADAARKVFFGTRALLDAALAVGAKRFLHLSSTAAVAPVSVAGAAERLAELYVRQAAARARDASSTGPEIAILRLPEILGAEGTILPLLVEQLERGLPLSLPHVEAERTFVTIGEAARAVLEATAQGGVGEVLVPSGGQRLRLRALAERLCEAAGLRLGVDVPVQFVGLAPGERIAEPLARPDEAVIAHHATRSGLVTVRADLVAGLDESLDGLAEAALAGRDPRVLAALSTLLPEYRPAPAAAEASGFAEPVPLADGAVRHARWDGESAPRAVAAVAAVGGDVR